MTTLESQQRCHESDSKGSRLQNSSSYGRLYSNKWHRLDHTSYTVHCRHQPSRIEEEELQRSTRSLGGYAPGCEGRGTMHRRSTLTHIKTHRCNSSDCVQRYPSCYNMAGVNFCSSQQQRATQQRATATAYRSYKQSRQDGLNTAAMGETDIAGITVVSTSSGNMNTSLEFDPIFDSENPHGSCYASNIYGSSSGIRWHQEVLDGSDRRNKEVNRAYREYEKKMREQMYGFHKSVSSSLNLGGDADVGGSSSGCGANFGVGGHDDCLPTIYAGQNASTSVSATCGHNENNDAISLKP